MSIGWALLGPGRHVERNVIEQMKSAAGVRLVAVLSRDRARGEAFAARHGFARAYTSLSDVLRDPEVEALYDATPDGLHASNIVAAAEAGKHTLVEKPLAISVAECARAVEACRRRGVKLGVVYQQRHDAAHQEARRLIANGAIGDVMLARALVNLGSPTPPAVTGASSWRVDPALRSGGVLMSLSDHAFDTLSYILGQEIMEAAAFTDATSSSPPNERVAGLLLKYSGGAIAHAASSGKTPFGRRPFEFLGTQGSLAIENSFAYLTGAGADPRVKLELTDRSGTSERYFEPTPCFRFEIEQFGRAIRGDGEPMTSATEAMRAMEIVTRVYQAMGEGRVAELRVKGA